MPLTRTAAIDPAALFPASRKYFRYKGSLTTPPFSDGVPWTVFKDPIEASSNQIRQLVRRALAREHPARLTAQ